MDGRRNPLRGNRTGNRHSTHQQPCNREQLGNFISPPPVVGDSPIPPFPQTR
jgi:hypothetical protein